MAHVIDECDDKEHNEHHDQQAPQQRSLDGLEVDNHVGNKEAYHPKHPSARSNDNAADVLESSTQELPPRARQAPHQKYSPRAVFALQVCGHGYGQKNVGQKMWETAVHENCRQEGGAVSLSGNKAVFDRDDEMPAFEWSRRWGACIRAPPEEVSDG